MSSFRPIRSLRVVFLLSLSRGQSLVETDLVETDLVETEKSSVLQESDLDDNVEGGDEGVGGDAEDAPEEDDDSSTLQEDEDEEDADDEEEDEDDDDETSFLQQGEHFGEDDASTGVSGTGESLLALEDDEDKTPPASAPTAESQAAADKKEWENSLKDVGFLFSKCVGCRRITGDVVAARGAAAEIMMNSSSTFYNSFLQSWKSLIETCTPPCASCSASRTHMPVCISIPQLSWQSLSSSQQS